MRLANNLLFYWHELFACHRNQLFDSSFPGKGLEAMRQPGTPAGTAWSVDAELGGKWQPTEGLVPASRYCLPGDTVTSAIKGIGVLENPVIQYQDNLNSP